MRTWDEIGQDGRLLKDKWDVDPVNRERFSGKGWLKVKGNRIADAAFVIWGSNENGWEHVSVSFPGRCPTWDEMCIAKDVFWREDEACIQVHPERAVYINIHNYCLHIWRPKDGKLILPPDAIPKEAQKRETAEPADSPAGEYADTPVLQKA